MTGNVAQFGFSAERDGEPVKVTYAGKNESLTKMSRTAKFEGAAEGVSGTWTAVKQ